MTQPCHQELKFVSLIVIAAIVLVVGEQYAEHLGRNTTTSKPLSMADETWNEAKRDGWRTRKIADEWLHGCHKCGAPT